MEHVAEILTVSLNQVNGHLFGAHYYPHLPQKVMEMQEILGLINNCDNFDNANLPGGFK